MDLCCQLHSHSSYSFKDGLARPEKLVARAAELGQPGIGITEHGHVYSAPVFFTACKEAGIKGVIGMEAYEAVPYTWDPDPTGPHHAMFKVKHDPNKPKYHHLTLWAMNQTGWENLCAIHTKSFSAGYKPKNQPLVDRATLEQHHEGLIIGLGCRQSRTNWTLAHRGYEAAVQAAEWYFDVAAGRVYVEVMSGLPEQVRALDSQRRLARHFGASTLGVNDVHYLRQSDGVLGGPHHMLVMARKFKSTATETEATIDQSDDAFGAWYGSDQFYLKNRQEMIQSGIFADEVDRTLEVLDRVDFDFKAMPEPAPPTAHVPQSGKDPDFDAYVAAHT